MSEKPQQRDEICPGEEKCVKFIVARAETKNGLEACKTCRIRDTKPDPNAIDETDALYEEIEDIVFWENAFPGKTDWNCYKFYHAQLYAEWRNCELILEKANEHQTRQMLAAVCGVKLK